MPRHPTVQVPNIGPMDHAWDLLGEWQAEFELPETESPVHGKVTFRSWTDAELMLDPIEAAIAGIPSTVPLERASEIHLTDAGGGALQWVLHAPSTNWSLQATMWPGSLHLFVSDADDDEEQLYRARAVRDAGVLPAEVPAGPGVNLRTIELAAARLRHSARRRAGGGRRALDGGAVEARGGRVRRIRRRRRDRAAHSHRPFRAGARRPAAGRHARPAAAPRGRDLPRRRGPLPVLRHRADVSGAGPLPAAARGGLRELPSAADA